MDNLADLRKRIAEVEKFRPLYVDLPLADAKNLLEKVDRLQSVLEPFAKHAHATGHIIPHNLKVWCENARTALSG